MKRLQVKVFGEVQGVSFRAFASREAQKLSVCGFAQNLPDGSVEIVAEGEVHALDRLLERLKCGNEYSQVERTEESWSEATGEFSGFHAF